MKLLSHILLGGLCLCLGFSCSNDKEKQDEKRKQDSLLMAGTGPSNTVNNHVEYSTEEGVIGVFDVPAMLTIGIIDSAKAADVPQKIINAYRTLQEDIQSTGCIQDGPAGHLVFNNDPENFKFECFFLIKEVPASEPKNSQVIVMDAAKMLIYNYYGSYQDLHKAYAEIKTFIEFSGLEQNGPLRELYVTDPSLENDPKKILTRVFVPVMRKTS